MSESERLLTETPSAPWLPAGSAAQVWVGSDCLNFEPAVIVRLLLIRTSLAPQFFVMPSEKGLDLPTRFLGSADRRASAQDGLADLMSDVVGDADQTTRCVGYVRNVVPAADDDYPHPAPLAHVPVFRMEVEPDPVVDGSWVTVDTARKSLGERHWWPIVEHALRPEEA